MLKSEIDLIHSSYRAHAGAFASGKADPLFAGVAVSARGATVRTADGSEFVDFASGGFGYGNRHVIDQVAAQIRRMPLSSRMFFSRPLAMLAARIGSIAPGALEVSFFGASGSEAMEGALKLARGLHPKRSRVVVARGAYHGGTTGALSVCGIEALRRPLGQLPLRAIPVPYGDVEALARAVDDETLAVVMEPALTSTGLVLPPAGYLALARARATATDALLIIDEARTALGRTGRLFAIEAHEVSPDILVLGSALGAGVLPIGAYVATRQLNARVYDKRDPLLHANTTGGNPSACTAALAGLDVIEREGLCARAAEHGARIADALAALSRRHRDVISGYECLGLLASIRVRDGASAVALQRRALQRGVLTRLGGLASGEPWLDLRPPLLVDRAEIELGLDALSHAAADVLSSRSLGVEAAQ